MLDFNAGYIYKNIYIIKLNMGHTIFFFETRLFEHIHFFRCLTKYKDFTF